MDFNTLFGLLPEKLKASLDKKDKSFASKIWNAIEPFVSIIEQDLFFFPEYTDHGINHFINILQCIEIITEKKTLEQLSSKEIGVLFLSVILHDIGMHTSEDMFVKMIAHDGCYDKQRESANLTSKYLKNFFKNDKPWQELWQDYLKDFKFWNDEKKKNVLGHEYSDSDHEGFEERLLKRDLKKSDRMFIGEFIRINHCRIAYEVALYGYFGKEEESMKFDGIEPKYLQMAALVARSHGMKIRDMYQYIDAAFKGHNPLRYPDEINVIFLMVLVRLADYLHLENRTDPISLKLRSLNSSTSAKEHEMHCSIEEVQYKSTNDPEKINVVAEPKNARTYVKIIKLVEDLQNEFDVSWAVLGENRIEGKPYNLQFRRITTNLSNVEVQEDMDFLPKELRFRFNDEVAKLLVAPLYGNNPTFAVRELVQNAVDACRERKARDKNYSPKGNPDVRVTVNEIVHDRKKKYLFTIVDSGKGMTPDEIEKYFLTIGSSYSSNTEWQKFRDVNNVYRTGRFGIGVLAAFLLGQTIVVETRSMTEDVGYKFEASLQSSFIEIKRIKKHEIGTTITIECEKDSFEELKNQAEKSHDSTPAYMISDRYYWYNWYMNTDPKVEYYFCNTKLDVIDIYNSDRYRTLQHNYPGYGEIKWLPRWFSFFGSSPSLHCNGFFITSYPNKREFTNRIYKKYYPAMSIPYLVIEDKNNRIPLNLLRTNIDGNITYEFEEELAKDVLKVFINELMSIKHLKELIRNPRDFYFCPTGFALKCEYVNEVLSGETLVTILLHNYDNIGTLIKKIAKINEKNVVFQFILNKQNYLFRERIKSNSNDDNKSLIKRLKLYFRTNKIDFITEEIKAASTVGISAKEIEEKKEAEAPFEEIVKSQYPNGNPIIPYNNIYDMG